MFHFRLALKFGRADVAAFIDELDSETLNEWRTFAEADGWASQWDHTAELVAWMQGLAGSKQALTPDELRRLWRGKPIERKLENTQSVDELKRQRASGHKGY